MSDDKLSEVLRRLQIITEQQQQFSKEIIILRRELDDLKKQRDLSKETSRVETAPVIKEQPLSQVQHGIIKPPAKKKSTPRSHVVIKKNWEKFIGENLISKIGILIIVIGVGIGAKYAIDHQMVNPLTRIVLGYLSGLILIAFGIKLKAKYQAFSAVLVGGALAILYFITYAAYDFYGLLPRLLAFGLMVLFTGFGILAALKYNMQVIAHIGLVGAYGVPFLLSSGGGNVALLFGYMTIINLGILYLSFKRDWRRLYYSAFVLSWLIFFSWAAFEYDSFSHTFTGLSYGFVFFIIFYITLLAYQARHIQKLKVDDIVLLLANAFIFYALGLYFLSNYENGDQFLGLFTIANAFIHFVVGVFIRSRSLADKKLLYIILGLVITFLTVTVPVQLDGGWVTILWSLEAAILFWLGRHKKIEAFEKLSYIVMVIGFFSLIEDWESHSVNIYYDMLSEGSAPYWNISFLSSIIVTGCFGWINYVHATSETMSLSPKYKWLPQLIRFGLPVILIVCLYNTFRLEIENYWNIRYLASTVDLGDDGLFQDYDLLTIRDLWNLYYGILFFTALLLINLKKIKQPNLGYAALILGGLIAAGFLTSGLLMLSDLRDSYLNQDNEPYFTRGFWHLGMRYIGYTCLGAFFIITSAQLKQNPNDKHWMIFHLFVSAALIAVLSSELLNIMAFMGKSNAYRLSLSILWGMSSLALIVMGIWKKLRHLRIAAIVLFGITLLKVFFIDISNLNTISKTIVFVALGVLMLIVSFLYNKYKYLIFDDGENP